jgi:CRISPR system Cascade subunit CasD
VDAIILRLDAPLMSFGGVIVDQHNVTDRFPGVSLFVGLIGNALGWTHCDGDSLNALQSRLRVASRWDAMPDLLIDYQTVDLGEEKMCNAGWTTRGEPEHREGGPNARFGTHPRLRHYWANGLMTVALGVSGEADPTMDAIERTLRRPARPLFLGRKTCIPSAPLVAGRASGPNLREILERVPHPDCRFRKEASPMPARWPVHDGGSSRGQARTVFDLRDWNSGLHVGSRQVVDGAMQVPECI